MNIRFHANYEIWNESIALYAKSNDGIASRIEFKAADDGLIPEPFARIDMESAQHLANALWDAGIRPAQGKNSEGVNAAQGAHLQDMRAIAFGKLGITKP